MVLGKLPVPGRPLIWMIVGQGPIALALGADGVVRTFSTLRYLWSDGVMALGKLLIWMIVGQRPPALAVGAAGGCLDICTLIYPFSPLSPSLWETARYRLKYCLKGPLNQKTNNQRTLFSRSGRRPDIDRNTVSKGR